MMKFNKILVPLDGSSAAEAALTKAVELIRNNREATLILLRTVEVRTLPGVDPIDAQVSAVHEAQDYLEAVAARLRDDDVPGGRTSVWYGAAAPSIFEAPRRGKPALILTSPHGRRGTFRPLLGSV